MFQIFTSDQNPKEIIEIKATNASVDFERVGPGLFWLIISADGSTEYLCIGTKNTNVTVASRSKSYYAKKKNKKTKNDIGED